jgi:hypothetical protein
MVSPRRRGEKRASLPALIFSLLAFACPQAGIGEIRKPSVLPLPRRVPDGVAGGRAYVMAHPELFMTVGNANCEFRSIKEALARVPDGRSKICVMDPAQRESLIKIFGEVEIFGFGAAETAIEAAARPEDSVDWVIKAMPGSRVLLSGLTVRGGNNTEGLRFGGGVINAGNLVIEDCAIVENIATAGAGIWTTGPLIMRRTLVASNRVIHRPAAEEAAGIGCRGAGGGMKIDVPGTTLLEDCLFAWNESLKGGGGIHVSCETGTRLSGCTIYGNKAGGRGAGIDLAGGKLVLERCTIAGNEGLGPAKAIFNRGLLSITGSLLACEFGTAYTRATDGGGDIGVGTLVENEGNYCQSGSLPGAAAGPPGMLILADHGGPTWSALPEAGSPAYGYGAGAKR